MISENSSNKNYMLGQHCILELYECDPFKLNDEAFIRTTISSAAKIAGAQLLNLITHSFKPQGITGIALLAESHISIHTWPESRYAAVDVFTCGDNSSPEKACYFFECELKAQSKSLKTFARHTQIMPSNYLRNPNLVDMQN